MTTRSATRASTLAQGVADPAADPPVAVLTEILVVCGAISARVFRRE